MIKSEKAIKIIGNNHQRERFANNLCSLPTTFIFEYRLKIIIQEFQAQKVPIQKLADTVAGYFVPAVVGVAVLALVVWGLWGPEPKLAHAVINAVAVLLPVKGA